MIEIRHLRKEYPAEFGAFQHMILHGIFFSLSGTYQIRSPSEYLNLSEETESNCLSEILKEDFLFI